MAMSRKTLERRKANRVDPKTVQVGDRVKFGRTVGVVLSVSGWSRKFGMGSIMWEGDAEPTMSVMGCWWRMQKA